MYIIIVMRHQRRRIYDPFVDLIKSQKWRNRDAQQGSKPENKYTGKLKQKHRTEHE